MTTQVSDIFIRDILRHLDEPGHLQQNPVAARWLAAGADIRECLEGAVIQLPARLRVVVIRCDLARELHSFVAADLEISERHLYRLRRQALRQLASIVANSPVRPQLCTPEPDPLEVHLSRATAHENAGEFDAAIRTLKDAEPSLTDMYQRARTACRLADVCCSANSFAAAKEHLEHARWLASSVPISGSYRDLIESLIEIISVKLAWRCRDLERLQDNCERIARRLRYLTTDPTDPLMRQDFAQALASVLIVLVDVRCEKGAFGDALAVALELGGLLDRYSIVNPALRLTYMRTIAYLRAFTAGGFARTIEELGIALAYAEACALPCAAISIAGDIGGAYAVRGDMNRALHFGSVALQAARSICPPEELVRTIIELASTYVIGRDSKAARAVLREAVAHISADDYYLASVISLTDADIHILEGDYAGALALARKAKGLIERLGSDRFFGSALRIEAEAQEALGHRRAAARAIGESVHILESAGHAFTLARAYQSSARICERKDHLLAANDLARTIAAI